MEEKPWDRYYTLQQAINEFMQAWNQNPKSFIWKASVGQIVEKINLARAKMERIKPGSSLPKTKTGRHGL